MKKIFTALLFCMSINVAEGLAQDMQNTIIKVGQKAPELKYPNPDGKEIRLSDIYKGRYVLLDFWASWCRPCRGANPRVVAIYNKYKDVKLKGAKNGFTIVSVSMDKNKEAWIKAIETDKLAWEHHMSDLGGWDSKPAVEYGVQYIPQAFLIDPDGKVVKMYNFPENVAADLEKLMVK